MHFPVGRQAVNMDIIEMIVSSWRFWDQRE
jgi:hypothetical protein